MAAHCQGIDQLLPEQLTKLAIDADRARRADCPRSAVDRPTQVGQKRTLTPKLSFGTHMSMRRDKVGPLLVLEAGSVPRPEEFELQRLRSGKLLLAT